MNKKMIINIKQILKHHRITQKELAYRSQLTQAAISQILNNKRTPTLFSILKITKALNVKFSDIIC